MSEPFDGETPEEHKARMKRVKAQQDAEVKSKKIRRGVVVVHTGHGKGKSTAGFGVALRARGHGQRVAVVQFIKGAWKTGEQEAIRMLGGVDHVISGSGFTWNTQDREADVANAQDGWAQACAFIEGGEHDVVILDEINMAMHYGYLEPDAVAQVLRDKPEAVSIVLTGRECPEAVIDAADTVTEHQLVKHAYQAGIRARKGIEF